MIIHPEVIIVNKQKKVNKWKDKQKELEYQIVSTKYHKINNFSKLFASVDLLKVDEQAQ